MSKTKKYWDKFYEKYKEDGPSSFAVEVLFALNSKDKVVDLGCGNGRDVYFFRDNEVSATGVDESFESRCITKDTISNYMSTTKSPKHVYTRFFWHAIPREEQLKVLDWVSEWIYIEARTTEDQKRYHKFTKHYRNYVSVPRLVKDLKDNGFQIVRLEEGTGFSKFKGEDPHLVRVVARKL